MTEIKYCIICGKELPEHRMQQGKSTCCRSCQFKTPEYRQKRSESFKRLWSNEEKRQEQSKKLKKVYENEEMRQKMSDILKKTWSNEEKRQEQSKKLKKVYENTDLKEAISKASIKMWNSKDFKEKMSTKQKESWSDVKKRQSMSKKLKQAYQDNPELAKQHSEKLKELWQTKEYKQVLSNSLKRAYAERNLEIQQKRYETMKKNNSFAQSTTEDKSYQLLKTECPDVVRQYLDKDRYPFKVDLYVPSLDLFIECHYSEFHQYEPFDATNEEHLERLKCLQNKADEKFKQTGKESRYHKMIYTWTDLDVRKRQCAIDNKLNWLCFYTYGDFERWLNENKI